MIGRLCLDSKEGLGVLNIMLVCSITHCWSCSSMRASRCSQFLICTTFTTRRSFAIIIMY
jgi:hypothetical protein